MIHVRRKKKCFHFLFLYGLIFFLFSSSNTTDHLTNNHTPATLFFHRAVAYKSRKKSMDVGATYTLEECINSIGLGKFQWRLITILGFCTMADAVEMMLLAILGPALTCFWLGVTEVQIASLTTVTSFFFN